MASNARPIMPDGNGRNNCKNTSTPSDGADGGESDRIPEINPEQSILETRGVKCVVHKWTPPHQIEHGGADGFGRHTGIRGVAVVYHGLGAHALYPTVRYAASLLAKSGFVTFALDCPGHGASPGTRGLLTGVEDLIQDGLAIARFALRDATEMMKASSVVGVVNGDNSNGDVDDDSVEKNGNSSSNDQKNSEGVTRRERESPPLFLVGSSMGGAIAIAVAEKMDSPVAGVAMLAPMLSLNVSSLEWTALQCLSLVIPSAPLIPSSATSAEKQYRDPDRRAECERDSMTYRGKLRISSALTCVELAHRTRENFGSICAPFLCMIAEEDVVVKNSPEVLEELMTRSPSKDKTMTKYAALHGLLCEPAPLLGIIEKDLVKWMSERCPGPED